MEFINYHHLLYFWVVAREGSIARASSELRLARPTISEQIHQLEASLGERLFARSGRNLVLTEMGRVAFGYADAIFSLGRELTDTVKGRSAAQPLRFVVGVADVLPKPIVRRLLEPAFHLERPTRLVCLEDKPVSEFVGELAAHRVHVVLADAPVSADLQVRAVSHLLGECGTTFFATKAIAASLRGAFPRSLDGAPLLLPTSRSTIRRALDEWFHAHAIRPAVVAEFDDPALMNVFGQDGVGVFPGPAVIDADIRRRYQAQVVGRAADVRQRFYAITAERELEHPAVVAIREAARREIFKSRAAGSRR
jgi:LysR family transcriptional activator of nhaA